MNHESEIQYVVRHVVAKYLDRVKTDDEPATVADKLRNADNDTLEALRKDIEDAEKGWSEEFHVYAMRNEGVYWRLMPTLIETENEGPLVKLEWGWGAGVEGETCPSVTISGGDAFDLAVELLKMFEDEDGEVQRPERPEYPEWERPPEVSKFFDEFSKIAGELMKKEGFDGSVSMAEATAWVRSGKPDEPLKHEWVDYPEDHVQVCSVCGSYYHTDRDDWGGRVCAGEPVTDDDRWSNIHNFDPRRSGGLREAQRLDRLITVMGKVDATEEEMSVPQARLEKIVGDLNEADVVRYEKERVGLGD